MQGVGISEFNVGVIIGICIGWVICMFLDTFEVKLIRRDRD